MNTFQRQLIPDVTTTLRPITYSDDARTLIVYGCPRGGTTMVAATCDALGFDFGPPFPGHYDFEDMNLNGGTVEQRLAYIQARNTQSSIWAVKDPMMVTFPFYSTQFFAAVRNPVVLLVYRDILATAQSIVNADIASQTYAYPSLSERLSQVTSWMQSLTVFAVSTMFPLLLISYERAIANREAFVAQLAAFLGVPATAGATDRISPTGGYLQP